jgi:chemotaxis regulatin CheY-phosphate phosphatase CheZ
LGSKQLFVVFDYSPIPYILKITSIRNCLDLVDNFWNKKLATIPTPSSSTVVENYNNQNSLMMQQDYINDNEDVSGSRIKKVLSIIKAPEKTYVQVER